MGSNRPLHVNHTLERLTSIVCVLFSVFFQSYKALTQKMTMTGQLHHRNCPVIVILSAR